MKHVLILEDSPDRNRAFKTAMATLESAQPFFWDSAEEMIQAMPSHLDNVGVISLDYDLVPYSKSNRRPGTGLDVCSYLATIRPVCPIILHTSNEEAVWPMLFSLTEGKWETEWLRHDPIGEFWIGMVWLPRVKLLLHV